MPTVDCASCGKAFEEGEFTCPHCGTAVIPQMSKTQVRMEALKASEGPQGIMLLGMVFGLLVGGINLTIALVRGEAGLAHGAGVILAGMLGGSAGIAVFYWRRRRRERRPDGAKNPGTDVPGSPDSR